MQPAVPLRNDLIDDGTIFALAQIIELRDAFPQYSENWIACDIRRQQLEHLIWTQYGKRGTA